MYTRSPDSTRQKIKIPENYSGHTFREPSAYNDMPPPIRVDPQHQINRELTEPHVNSSSRYIENDQEESARAQISNEDQDESASPPLSSAQHFQEKEEKPQSSIFASLLPASSSSHFPFGHGIGSEELMILAIMLLVFLSEDDKSQVDNELLLFLGILLFAG